MRKILTVAVLAAALGAGLPANAASKTATILLPTAFQGTELNCLPTDSGCEKITVARHTRCAYLEAGAVAQDNTTGKFGYVVAVTGGAAFNLAAASGQVGDFDITFYSDLGTCSERQRVAAHGVTIVDVGRDSTPNGTARTDAWGASKFGTDSGTVPAGARWGIITLTAGANARFNFTN